MPQVQPSSYKAKDLDLTYRALMPDVRPYVGAPAGKGLVDVRSPAEYNGDIIAPPTFPVTFRSDRAGTETLLHDLGVDIGRILHGEQEFEHFKPILPGRTYLCRGRNTDIYEKTGKSGPMAFVVRETTITDGDNDIVCVTRAITVVRL